ncbi:MAG: hypothetical protein GXY83_15675 [Rhodopirellula sp.]|nr:hypothetical protein [Rhodopirellula sp.]
MNLIRRLLLSVILIAPIVLGCGCWPQRTYLIPPGEPVQLAEDVKAYVFITVDGKRIKSPDRVKLPAGWWVLPDPEE